MGEVTCVCESVYRGALTRGRRYEVLTIGPHERQFRIRGDNDRVRWFPASCFVQPDQLVPLLASWHLDDLITASGDAAIEVTVQLTNGQQRWCIFATPSALANCGEWIDGTKVPFHCCNRHIIVANRLSEELIERMLRQIDAQGQLIECTLSLGGSSQGSAS